MSDSNVDLPEPDRPVIATTSPEATSKLTSRRAGTLPWRLLTCCTDTTAPRAAPDVTGRPARTRAFDDPIPSCGLTQPARLVDSSTSLPVGRGTAVTTPRPGGEAR